VIVTEVLNKIQSSDLEPTIISDVTQIWDNIYNEPSGGRCKSLHWQTSEYCSIRNSLGSVKLIWPLVKLEYTFYGTMMGKNVFIQFNCWIQLRSVSKLLQFKHRSFNITTFLTTNTVSFIRKMIPYKLPSMKHKEKYSVSTLNAKETCKIFVVVTHSQLHTTIKTIIITLIYNEYSLGWPCSLYL
jgi:hypothetical protein